jgi:hypothetical protein
LVHANSRHQWFVPYHGRLEIEYVYSPRCASPIECLNATGLARLIKMLASHRASLPDLLRICSSCLVLETYQLEEIMISLQDLNLNRHSQFEVYMKLLICVRDGSNADSLTRKIFRESWAPNELSYQLKSLNYVILGNFTGYYQLEMANFYDRLCAIRLAEINAEELGYIKRVMPQWAKSKFHYFTSQSQRRSNFRNILFKQTAAVLDNEFFSHGLMNKMPGTTSCIISRTSVFHLNSPTLSFYIVFNYGRY